jgi:capping protein alpha
MSDDEYEPATPAQKLNIASYFVMSSPTGEVDEVVLDVAKLIGDESTFSSSKVSANLREYNLDRLTAATTPDDSSVLITPYNEVEKNHYADPNADKVWKFDHRRGTFSASDKSAPSSSGEALRKSTQTALTKYIDETYKKGKCTGVVFATSSGDLVVCISGKNTNLGNFWTGGWKACYKVSQAGKISGTVKVNVHYFEDGNVQMHTTHKLSTSTSADGAKIVKEIADFETKFQTNLEEMYVNMHRTTFKAMRRILPVSRQPMKWSSAAHKVAGQVGK